MANFWKSASQAPSNQENKRLSSELFPEWSTSCFGPLSTTWQKIVCFKRKDSINYLSRHKALNGESQHYGHSKHEASQIHEIITVAVILQDIPCKINSSSLWSPAKWAMQLFYPSSFSPQVNQSLVRIFSLWRDLRMTFRAKAFVKITWQSFFFHFEWTEKAEKAHLDWILWMWRSPWCPERRYRSSQPALKYASRFPIASQSVESENHRLGTSCGGTCTLKRKMQIFWCKKLQVKQDTNYPVSLLCPGVTYLWRRFIEPHFGGERCWSDNRTSHNSEGAHSSHNSQFYFPEAVS